MNALETVQLIENVIADFPQSTYEIRHHFAGGIYEREMIVPAREIFTGKIHLTEHLCKLSSGVMSIAGDDVIGIFTGPMTFISKPGAKRIGRSHTPCSFSTFHYVGEERDIETIEKRLVVDTIEEYQALLEKEEQCHLLHQEQR
jgi:hypothetical protein